MNLLHAAQRTIYLLLIASLFVSCSSAGSSWSERSNQHQKGYITRWDGAFFDDRTPHPWRMQLLGIHFDDEGTIFQLGIHSSRCGLRQGDVVLELNGIPLSEYGDVAGPHSGERQSWRWIEFRNQNDPGPVMFTISRNGSTKTVEVAPLDLTEDFLTVKQHLSTGSWPELVDFFQDRSRPIYQCLPPHRRHGMYCEALEGLRLENRRHLNYYLNNRVKYFNLLLKDSKYSRAAIDEYIEPSHIHWMADQLRSMGSNLVATDLIARWEAAKKKPSETSATSRVTTSSGTGFFISADGHILTAYHVVEDAEAITITTSDGVDREASIISYSKANDLAVLKTQALGSTYLPLQKTRGLNLGRDIFTMGFPATGILGEEIKYSDGSIASLSGVEGEQSLIQMTVPIQPGNSGGPVVTEDGFAIGVVTSTAAIMPFIRSTGSLPQNVNWAVKSDYAMLLHEQETELPAVSKEEAIKRTEAATCRITAKSK